MEYVRRGAGRYKITGTSSSPTKLKKQEKEIEAKAKAGSPGSLLPKRITKEEGNNVRHSKQNQQTRGGEEQIWKTGKDEIMVTGVTRDNKKNISTH